MITMCKPEMERMWNKPESRMAWFVSSVIPPRSPVMRAAAISPASPAKAALMRALIAALGTSIDAHILTFNGAGGASLKRVILLVA
jgi:hypothetical protein